MTIAIQPASNPADINTEAPEHTQWIGIDGAIYDASLRRHPISHLAYYVVTRDGEECGAILAEALRRTVRVGYKLPFPIPSTSAARVAPQAQAYAHALRPTPRPSQFRALKDQLQARGAK